MTNSNQQALGDNYNAFVQMLPSIIRAKRGKFALMHAGDCQGYYDTIADAVIVGELLFKSGGWSAQQVTTEPIDLGFFSHV